MNKFIYTSIIRLRFYKQKRILFIYYYYLKLLKLTKTKKLRLQNRWIIVSYILFLIFYKYLLTFINIYQYLSIFINIYECL